MSETKKEMSYYEKLSDYEILIETIDEKRNCRVIDFKNKHFQGTARLYIPIHTEEEKKSIADEITRAMFKMCFPDEDFSNTNLHIIM